MFIYVVTLMSAVGGFLFGYDTGVISGAMLLLRDYFHLSSWNQEIVVSVTIVAAWMFSLIGGSVTDRFGRKPVIIVASFIFTAGALLLGFAINIEMLIAGRFVVGSGIGLASMTVPMYIAEVSPANIRGRLVTINNFCITFGQLTAAVVDGIFSNNHVEGWRYMLGIAAVPSALQFFGFLFMPESPRWLISRNKDDEAIEVLRNIRQPEEDIKSEFQSIKESWHEIQQELETRKSSYIIVEVLKTPTLRRALIVGCGLQIFQQLAGINTVMYYSATIIQMSGVKGTSKILWLSCATAAMNCLCSVASLFFVEKIGRRLLTLLSLGGVILSLCFLAVSFQIADLNSPALTFHDDSPFEKPCSGFSDCSGCISKSTCGFCYYDTLNGPANGSCLVTDSNYPETSSKGLCNSTELHDHLTWAYGWCPSPYSWMTFLGLLLYLICFAPGMGPMPWTINSEIYPLWARSTCYGVSTSMNWLFNFLISVSFISLTEAITKYGAFWLYAGISSVGFVFLLFTLPETRGKSLEEVEGLFAHFKWREMFNEEEKKTVQYVHIHGINHPCAADDSDEES